jgi:hypothetical protein
VVDDGGLLQGWAGEERAAKEGEAITGQIWLVAKEKGIRSMVSCSATHL